MKKTLLALLLFANIVKGQLSISSGATFTIQSGGVVTVQGDIVSNADITGAGKVLLKGTTTQNVNMNGFTIPNLEMDNATNAVLTGNARIGSSALFTNGKIQQGNFNVRLADVVTTSGAGASKFFETNGTGHLIKEISTNQANYEMPVGIGTFYLPTYIQSTGTYASATVGVQAKDAITIPYAKRHIRSTDYANVYWPITQTGITGALRVKGNYASAFTGVETDMRGYYNNGTDWSSTNANIDYAQDTAGAAIVGNGDLYAMNKFVLAKIKVFLQGAYNGVDMNDALRTPTNLIPSSDPYRTPQYTTNFTHINNAIGENVEASVFNNTAITGDNIVDWVFLELRDNSIGNPGATVVQTRAALIQRDGDIVDIDGVSPIYFKNLNASATYTLAIRHRNHIGIATDPVANLQSLSEATPVVVTNFTTMTDAQIFGTSAAFTTSGVTNMLWGGNANGNNKTNFINPGNDKDYLLITALSNNPSGSITNTYNIADVNMNRTVRFINPNNDKDFILVNVLGNSPSTSRVQQLPQ